MKRRARLVADNGGHLPRLGGADQVHALAPYRAARARGPLHRRRVDGDARGKITVDRLGGVHAYYGTRSRASAIEHVAADRRDAAARLRPAWLDVLGVIVERVRHTRLVRAVV